MQSKNSISFRKVAFNGWLVGSDPVFEEGDLVGILFGNNRMVTVHPTPILFLL